MKTRLLFFLLLPAFCKAQASFELAGSVPASLEGKMIRLTNKHTNYAKNENLIEDSCIVQNGQFLFRGILNNPATLVSLVIDRPDFGISQFFLESRKMSITIYPTDKKNLFDSSMLINAAFDQQRKELELIRKPYNKKMAAFFERSNKTDMKGNDSLRSAFENEYELLAKEETDLLVGFIKSHPDYYLSLFWFCYSVTDRTISNPKKSMAIFRLLDNKLRGLPEGQAVQQRIATKLALNESKYMPDFSIADLTGKQVTLTDFRNKYLLIDFWASWCGPCVEQIPAVKDIYGKYRKKNLAILSISLDDNRDRWESAVSRHDLPWTQVSDLKGWHSPISEKMDIRYIPQYYLVGPDGKFILREASLEQVKNYLSSTL